MKKSLIALAALAATASFAQSSVVLSGAVDVAYANKAVSAGTGVNLGKATGVAEGQNTANRINFTMTEDLGGGQKAGAMVEMGLNITNGQLVSTRAAAAGVNVVNAGSTTAEIPTGSYSTATNRQSYVFTNGGFGEIRAGYTRTNLYELSTFSGYLVGQEQYGSLLHTFGNSVFGGTRANGLTWITPSMNGFKATLQYGAGADREQYTTDVAAGVNGVKEATLKRTGLKLDYNNGPLNVAYARTNVTAKTIAGSTNNSGTSAVAACTIASGGGTCAAQDAVLTVNNQNIFGAPAAAAAAADYKSHLDQLAASYEIGALKLTGHYLNGKKEDAAGTSASYKAKNIGAIYTIGQVGLFASVGNGTNTTQAGVKTNDIKQSQFGVRYSLSKRTVAYVMTGESKDNSATTATAVAKGKVTGFGMAHSF